MENTQKSFIVVFGGTTNAIVVTLAKENQSLEEFLQFLSAKIQLPCDCFRLSYKHEDLNIILGDEDDWEYFVHNAKSRTRITLSSSITFEYPQRKKTPFLPFLSNLAPLSKPTPPKNPYTIQKVGPAPLPSVVKYETILEVYHKGLYDKAVSVAKEGELVSSDGVALVYELLILKQQAKPLPQNLLQSLLNALPQLEQRASESDSFAIIALAISKSNGFCGQKDQEAAQKLLQHQALQDNAEAMFELSQTLLKDEKPTESVEMLTKAAEKGHPLAQYLLAVECFDSSPQKAVHFLQLSADQGNIAAEFALANALLDGNLITKDAKKALDLLHHCAKNNHPDAEYLLAACFWNGNGVEMDKDVAKKYFQAAAVKGNIKAKEVLKALEFGASVSLV